MLGFIWGRDFNVTWFDLPLEGTAIYMYTQRPAGSATDVPREYGHTEKMAPGLYRVSSCIRAAFLEEVTSETIPEVLGFCFFLRVFYSSQLYSSLHPTTSVFSGSVSLSLAMNLPFLKVTMSDGFYILSSFPGRRSVPFVSSPPSTSACSFPASLPEKLG